MMENAKARPHYPDFPENRIKLVGWREQKMGISTGSPDFTNFAALEAESFIRKAGNTGGCGRRCRLTPSPSSLNREILGRQLVSRLP